MTVLPVEPDTAVVVDAGPDPGAADACLRDLGVARVPLLILTHFHADHVEGVPGVLRGRSVGAIEVTTSDEPDGERARVLRWAAADGIPVLRARRGEQRTAGASLTWQILWPTPSPAPDASGPNNSSIALLATLGPPANALRVALLGDLEPPAQAAVLSLGTPPRVGLPDSAPTTDETSEKLREGEHDAATPDGVRQSGPGPPPGIGRVDVLKVAHHGSANQDWSLMASLRPRLALVSCGEGNPYGHPAPRTVAGLKALGATVVRTDLVGDIAVLGDARTLAVATHARPVRGR